MDKYLLLFLNVGVFYLSHLRLLLWFICSSYLFSWALYLVFSSPAQTCENSSYTEKRWWTAKLVVGHWRRGLLLFWGGCFSLFIENLDLQPCGLQRNTRTLFCCFSALQLEPAMDCGMEEFKCSISNSVIQVSNQLRGRLRRMVMLFTFPCCYRQSLTFEGPRAGVPWLCCTGLRLLGSFSFLYSFCSCHVCAWLQVDLSLKWKLAVAWAASASFS